MPRSNRRLFLLLAALAACLAPLARVSAAPRPAILTGTIAVLNPGSDLLGVNSRLGVKTLAYTTSTLFLLNNHTTTEAGMQIGDQVEVTYTYHTGIATRIHVFREEEIVGRVVTAAANSIGLDIDGAVINYTVNSSSVLTARGYEVANAASLLDSRATVVYEPGTNLLLSLAAKASGGFGRVTAVNSTARTLTIAGAKTRAYTVDAAATITRNGLPATMASLVVGDQARVAYVRSNKVNRALVLVVKGRPAPPAGGAALGTAGGR